MDMVRIGKFLAELRRERGLTQEQLGERLGISNKTVSRWENGNYLPPVEMLVELSGFYNVSINEILSGKRLDESETKAAAEENLKSVLEESPFSIEEKRNYYTKKWKREHRLSFVVPAVTAVILIIVSALLDKPAGVITGCLVPIPARIIAYNKMAAYVEYKTFDVERKLAGKNSRKP